MLDDECRNPAKVPSTSYRYGCRCNRCKAGKAERTRTTSSRCVDCGAEVKRTVQTGPIPKRCTPCDSVLDRLNQSNYLRRIQGAVRACRDCGERFTVGTQPWTCGRCYSLRMNPGGQERGPWGQERSLTKRRVRMIEAAEDCALCGDPIDKLAHYTDRLAPQIDHIIQRVDGGTDDEENLRVVHRMCNNAWAKTVPHYRLAAARGALWLQSSGL